MGLAPAVDRHIPRDDRDDWSDAAVRARLAFLRSRTGAGLDHVARSAIDPADARGNVEGLIGAAQVPIGVAGPLLVDGEHARGEFYVPLATTEGALVASYNRGMKLLREAGGVRTTVVEDAMQRAPAFVFASAREARDFVLWLDERFDDVKAATDATTRTGRLKDIETYVASRIVFTRFSFTTGDAAGQNMTSKATAAGCDWIASHNPSVRRFYLESNIATDKKSSRLNMLRTRGKRVVAEATVPRALIEEDLGAPVEALYRARQVGNLGSFMAGSHSNGLHAANGLAALFIATGQDVACLAESSAALNHSEITPEGDYYISVTLPSLIVATYGGGTGLPTQRECLELLGCFGAGKVRKLAEIVAATVLAGELSLGWAVVLGDWVSAHERYGRNR
jgi:hydroxymethylglutaryl-CoA reductase (NADPH)